LGNECWAIGESKEGTLFAGDANSGGLYRSTNNGENWELASNLFPLTFAVDSNNVVYAGTFNGLYFSTDNGISWTENNFFTNIAVPSIVVDTNNNIYCGTGYYSGGNGVFCSKDGGQSWMDTIRFKW